MKPGDKIARPSKILRELTDKDLNQITRAVGDHARAQTIEQKERLMESLRKELASVRDAFEHHGRKTA